MLPLSALHSVGSKLNRPECVLAHSSGILFVPDWTGKGGVTVIYPDGVCRRVLQNNASFDVKANGITLEQDGTCLLAHLGDDAGGVYRMTADGTLTPEVLTVKGKPMPPSNFNVRDSHGRLWITVSTRVHPRANDSRADANTGFIAVAEPGDSDAAHIAATETAFQEDRLGRDLLGVPRGEKLKNISNLAFGGGDLKTAYLGNLLGQDIPWFESPVAGAPLPHWDAPVENWIDVGIPA